MEAILGELFFLGASLLCLLFAASARESFHKVSLQNLRKLIPPSVRRDRVEKLLDNPQPYIVSVVTLHVFSVTSVVIATLLLLSQISGLKSNPYLLYPALFATCLLLILCFSEFLPRILARTPERFLFHTFFLTRLLTLILWPVIKLIAMINRSLTKRGMPPAFDESSILHIVKRITNPSRTAHGIHEEEKEMIESIIQLRDVGVSEIMTPRTEMQCIDSTSPIKAAVEFAVESGHSRIPVYEGNRDNIIGILCVKDLLKYWNDPKRDTYRLRDILRKPFFIPESKRLNELLHEFRMKKLHMAVVLDEYGGTAGIITVEDILEEIVGEIVDEYDTEEEVMVNPIGENVAEVDGRTYVDELNEKLQTSIPEDGEYDTVGGFVFSYLGRIPKVGETFDYGGAQFTITDADERRVRKLKIVSGRKRNGT